jgi:hypothetical protein
VKTPKNAVQLTKRSTHLQESFEVEEVASEDLLKKSPIKLLTGVVALRHFLTAPDRSLFSKFLGNG